MDKDGPTIRIVGAVGGGVVAPFGDDLEGVAARGVHVGAGTGLGGGMRFLDFEVRKPTGERYRADSVLAYFGFGASVGERRGGGGLYYGVGLGGTDVTGPGVDDGTFTVALAVGANGYFNARDVAVGLAGEIGFLFAEIESADLPLHGWTFLAGVYVSY
jgi:hypothetical protein